MLKKLLAELLGTAWLVLAGCGSAVIALAFPDIGIGLVGVSLAFGLALLTALYAFGPISGGHFNPAVSIGLAVAGRFPPREVIPYLFAQVVGALVGALAVYGIASGKVGFDLAGGLGANGYAERSPGGYALSAGFASELVLTFVFVLVVLGATRARTAADVAPIAIGLALAAIHLLSIPVTNTSVNPARSTGPALLVGGWALHQLWLFWLAPVLGAVGAGGLWRWLGRDAA